MKLFSAIAALLMFATQAADAQSVRIAVDSLPPSQGNPFRTSLAPTIYVTAAIFDTLTRFDADARLQPSLAERWENIDPVTWRFYLRKNIVFSNGAPLTSEAVVTSVDYIVSEASAREGLKRELSALKSARAIDGSTVDIITTSPVPLLPRHVSSMPIVEPGQWRKLGRDGFAKQPIGTGPFTVQRMAANRWTLKKSPTSWRQPKLETVEILALPDTAARVQALEARQTDIAMVIGADNIPALEAAGARVNTYLVSSVYGFSFITTRKSPFQDVRVRRAINMGIDRARIVSALLAGRTVPANQPASRGVFGYNPDIPQYPYDPQGARRLLADAGYPNGFAFALDAPTGASAGDTMVFQQVQLDLKTIGVTMEVRTMPNTLYLNKIANVDFEADAFPIAWPGWPIMDVWRGLQIHSCYRPVPWFCEPSLTPKMQAALSEWDDSRALQLRREIGQAYHDLAPALFLYELPVFVGLGPRVKNFDMATNLISYTTLEVAP